jgi:hypothetical protein
MQLQFPLQIRSASNKYVHHFQEKFSGRQPPLRLSASLGFYSVISRAVPHPVVRRPGHACDFYQDAAEFRE